MDSCNEFAAQWIQFFILQFWIPIVINWYLPLLDDVAVFRFCMSFDFRFCIFRFQISDFRFWLVLYYSMIIISFIPAWLEYYLFVKSWKRKQSSIQWFFFFSKLKNARNRQIDCRSIKNKNPTFDIHPSHHQQDIGPTRSSK